MMRGNQWYYVSGEKQQKGPITGEELERLVAQGVITPETLVWNPGLADWTAYREVMATEGTGPGEKEKPHCSFCGREVAPESVVYVSGAPVCASCKPWLEQRIRERGRQAAAVMTVRPGGFWIRFLAKLIDVFILGIIEVPVALMLGFAQAALSVQPNALYVTIGMQVAQNLFNMVLVASYDTFFIGKYAATPGKMVCHLQVVTANLERVSYWRAFGRYWAELLSSMTLMIGYLMAAFDEEKRALHDHIAGTRVIYREE